MSGLIKNREPMSLLGELLAEGTAALAHLDAESLELLQVRAVQMRMEFGEELVTVHTSERGAVETASRYRVFAEVLRSTRSQLTLLERLYGRGKGSPWDR